MAFVFLLPLLLAMTAVVIGALIFLGLCLLTIGVTGAAMNRLALPRTGKHAARPTCNIAAIALGVFLLLIPPGYVLFAFLSGLLQ